MSVTLLDKYLVAIKGLPSNIRKGRVVRSIGIVIEAVCPNVSVGEICFITPSNGLHKIRAEVVGFKEGRILLMPFQRVKGISYGSIVEASGEKNTVRVSDELVGRVINAFGEPIDELGAISYQETIDTRYEPINPLDRKRIEQPIETGIKAIDTFMTIGKGQRMGLFAGSGVGKSTLLSSLCRNVKDEVNVIALIGERGREVEEFVNDTLGEEGLTNSIVICATAEEPPLVRVHAAYTACTIAEYFSNQGKDVLFTMDSITRFAMALREIGLSIGEPPTTKGYTTSVFSRIPEIIERCGSFKGKGSITAIFTVLVESGDFNDPIVDALRAILDGHIVLSRELAEKGHYPAIDVLKSVSRLFSRFNDTREQEVISQCKNILSRYDDSKELIDIGAFNSDGVENPLETKSLRINHFLQQTMGIFIKSIDAKTQLNKALSHSE